MYAKPLPLVSICIPTHDDETVVVDALRSAMAQDYEPLEIVVLDNHSSDETTKVVAETAGNDARVRLVRHAENLGMTRNFNACISEAAGEFLLILCADDLLLERCITTLARAMHDHPSAVLAACGRTFADSRLRPTAVHRARSSMEMVSGESLQVECFAYGNRIGEPSAVLFRRSAALRGFDAGYNQAMDLEMWFHLLESGSAVLLPQALCIFRQHGEQATQANLRSGRVVADKQRFFRQFAPRMGARFSLVEKLAWDARMASSVFRSTAAGWMKNDDKFEEVFYPRLFPVLVRPLVALGWKLRNALSS